MAADSRDSQLLKTRSLIGLAYLDHTKPVFHTYLFFIFPLPTSACDMVLM